MRNVMIAILLILGLAGCGSAPLTMPDVVGKRLDVAKSDLKRANIGDIEVLGGGVLGILNDSNWQVCEQLPAAGAAVTDKPRLTVERNCSGARPSGTPSPESSASAAESAAPTPTASATFTAAGNVTDITVDKLVDKINAAKAGGIKTGDLFRVRGVLTGSEYWGTGASGDYFVYLKTKVGSDLIVFVDESETLDWEDGTKVEMLLEAVTATINGETTDGWMRARTTRIVS